MKKLSVLLVFILLLSTACSPTAGTNSDVIKVGVVGSNEEEIWNFVKEELRKEDIHVEVVVFTDYNQPNKALDEGDIDLNAFQHYVFLEDYNAANNSNLQVIGETYLSPLGLYSNKVNNVEEIKEGDTIVVPNDPTNLGRALKLLESAGLITVNPDAGDLPVVEDILENPLGLKIEALDASQTARSLQDVTGSVINGGMAVDAGLIPSEDAIFLESLTGSSKPYINVIAVKDEDVQNETYKRIVEVFRSDENAQVITEVTKGACIPIWEIQ